MHFTLMEMECGGGGGGVRRCSDDRDCDVAIASSVRPFT